MREVKLNRTKRFSVKEQIENIKESHHLKSFHESLHGKCQLGDEVECEYCGEEFISSETDYKEVYMKI